ncbi:MAG TPA: hypothetical protein VHY22_16245, partial [Chthoniobacteraceae bacterium]|nr:hypothetical protein [Chthoniobacteraceae bacterium]
RFGPQIISTRKRDGELEVSGSCSMIDNQYGGTFTGRARNPSTYKGDNITVTIPGSPGIIAHLVDYP